MVFVYMVCCTFCYASMTALVKYLHEFPTPQIMFFRCFVALLLPLSYLILRGQFSILKTDRPALHIARSVTGLSAMALYFMAFQHLPLAEAQAIGRSKAVFITFFALLILREMVNRARVIALFLGFMGMLILVNPGIPNASVYVWYPVFGAIFAALAMICVRSLSLTDNSLSIVVYFMIFGSIVSLFLAIPVWQPMTATEFVLLSATGAFGVCGQIFMVAAYKYGEASYVAPFDYLELIWACFLGYVVWQETPAFHAILGSLVILISKMYLLLHERKELKLSGMFAQKNR